MAFNNIMNIEFWNYPLGKNSPNVIRLMGPKQTVFPSQGGRKQIFYGGQ